MLCNTRHKLTTRKLVCVIAVTNRTLVQHKTEALKHPSADYLAHTIGKPQTVINK